ncbi:group-specific protein [Lederbergia citrea]|uniref:group-specific protein n=1 Tax=Lederbergia citrea TaxID=2833581 RepID=UPI001BCA0FF4|nr:group-specific protein [Lederbergia citrea]
MIKIQVDESEIRQMYQDAIESRLEKLDKEMVYWDSSELKKRTCMSWNTIQNTFFFDDDFPKIKVGGKWYFPAEKVKRFLEEWLINRR